MISAAVIEELARAYGVECPAVLLAACRRIEAAEMGVTAGVTSDEMPSRVAARPVSNGALRTRRWRERLRLGLVGKPAESLAPAGVEAIEERVAQLDVPQSGARHAEASPTVTEPSPLTLSDVTRDASPQKTFPPRTPYRKTKKQQKGRNAQGHGVTVSGFIDRTKPDSRGYLWLWASDPIFLEMQAADPRRSLPVQGNGGKWCKPWEVAAAKERLATRVLALPVRKATAPPGEARAGEEGHALAAARSR